MTARPKKVVIDNIAYEQCPDCDFMSLDLGYDPRPGLRKEMIGPSEMTEHIREVHHLVWMRVGKKAGWWDVRKFKNNS